MRARKRASPGHFFRCRRRRRPARLARVCATLRERPHSYLGSGHAQCCAPGTVRPL